VRHEVRGKDAKRSMRWSTRITW